MNTLESYSILAPNDKTEECAKFVIDDTTKPYVLSHIMTAGRDYTLSFWIQSDTDGSISAAGTTFSSSTEWTYNTVTFTADTIDLMFYFQTAGVYYMYHPQLEIGNKTTDYTPAPEDTETLIQQLNDSITMVVSGLESISFMEQTEDGWIFGLGSVQDALDKTSSELSALYNELGSTNGTIDALNQNLNEVKTYVKIQAYENEPCIELGAGDSEFKVLITNTRIMFMEGSSVPTYITNQTMFTDKIRVLTEIQQGDFIWTERANGNLGLIWKGATS